MINYHRSAFGWNLLFRVHGSAVYRACLPGIISVFLYLLIRYTPFIENDDGGAEETLEHPYVIGVVVGGITFLIVFRASSSYSRYWEATSTLYGMQSKWMDATISTAGYHMQCDHYKKIKPPSYYDYPNLNSQFLTRDRERLRLNSIKYQKATMNEKRAQLRSINARVESDDELDDPDGTGMKKYNPHDKRNLMTHQGTLIQGILGKIPSGSGHGGSKSSTRGSVTSGTGTGTGNNVGGATTTRSSSITSGLPGSSLRRNQQHTTTRRPSKLLQQPSNMFESAAAVQERRTRTGTVSFAVRLSNSSESDNKLNSGCGQEEEGGGSSFLFNDDTNSSDGVGCGERRLDEGEGQKETSAANINTFESSTKSSDNQAINNTNTNNAMKEQRCVDFVDNNNDDIYYNDGRDDTRETIRTKNGFGRGGGRGTGRFSLNREQCVLQPHFLSGPPRLDGNWGPLFDDGKDTFVDPKHPKSKLPDTGFASYQGGRTPPLFLQELAHLSSLLTAVAMSTLRNDIDGAESPLDFYHIGSPWPEVDPRDIDLGEDLWTRFKKHIAYFFGAGRTPEERTKINAARPLSVLGGVSDAEIRFLQMARGPYAKTQLCWNWLSEFITREHIEGTLGEVGAPIISRVVQFLGDGMREYNHARKIMFIPFPFPHAQLSAIYVLVMIPMLPYLMQQYCASVWVGALLSFLSVTCLSAIHEVARELENPFRNIPNELPVCTLMAEFNETLLTMYAGFHPDSFWEVPEEFDDSLRSKGPGRVGGDGGESVDTLQGLSADQRSLQDSTRSLQSFGHDENDIQFHSGTAFPALSGSYSDEKVENSNSSLLNTVVEESEGAGSEEIIFGDTQTDDTRCSNERIRKKQLSPNNIDDILLNKRSGDGENENNDVDATAESPAGTEATTSTSSGTASSADTSTYGNDNNSNEVEQLRAIVQQQGKMMATMLEEQARLNQMIESLLIKEQHQQSKKER